MTLKSLYLLPLLVRAPVAAFAQAAPVPSSVTFAVAATMPTLKDSSRKDTFAVTLGDAQVKSQIQLTCSAGHTSMLIMREDKACAVAGNGSIVNPANQALLPRTQYSGGYVVKSDGSTDGSTLSINYLALGKVAPSTAAFSGSMNLKPEVTSTGAAALANTVLAKINSGGDSKLIDQRVDTVDLSRLFVPSAGLPSDKGCTWSGNMVFAYQTESWFLDLTANCDDKEYVLKGNMPLTASPGVDQQRQYDLTLTLPSAEATSDDALFASADANGDLFSAADGISAQIIMKESKYVTIDIDGVPTETPSQVDASGTFTGTNVPVETVRSLATLFGLLSSNLFGA
ncbi:hypothetical protein ABIB57_004164 [Devosia sp. UYZn731]|uniref:hypothetical protein n=1 Tax=Devosia sp. UYZn731 TaxID=3156345 RepID=UPI0033992733